MKSNKTVLVIEDEALLRELLCGLFEHSGYDARGCEDGKSALEASTKIDFDVIVTDYRLPNMNGADVTQHLRVKFPASFIIGVSSEDMREDFLAAGADVFLLKPYRYSEMLTLINVDNRTSA